MAQLEKKYTTQIDEQLKDIDFLERENEALIQEVDYLKKMNGDLENQLMQDHVTPSSSFIA